MTSRNLKKVLLLVTICILLVGFVSATETNKTTVKNHKVVKETAKTVSKSIKEPDNIVTNTKSIAKKNNEKNLVTQTKKSSTSKTFSVSTFKTLNSALTNTKYDTVTINIKSNIKLKDNQVMTNSIKKLTINGNGNTISGAKKYQFLVTKNTATIKNLKIINCYSSRGGAIQNEGTLTISNCTLNYNKAENSGAINNDGTLTIKNSKIGYNKASEEGGAISNVGIALKIINSEIYNNIANGFGGAITNGEKLTIKSSTLKNNEGYNGGAIRNDGTLVINDSVLKNNKATDTGGAIAQYESKLTIYKSELNSNKAKTGGAIWSVGKTTINYSTLNKNKATKNGGAVYSEKSRFMNNFTTMTIKNSKLLSNSPNGKKTVVNKGGKFSMDKKTLIK